MQRHNLTIWNKQSGIILSELKMGYGSFLCTSSYMLFICTKFHEDILNGFKTIEQTQPHYMK